MSHHLVGKSIYVSKPVRVVVRKEVGQQGFSLVPTGDSISIKAVGDDKTGLLVGEWKGFEVLVFEQDLFKPTNRIVDPESKRCHAHIEPLTKDPNL